MIEPELLQQDAPYVSVAIVADRETTSAALAELLKSDPELHFIGATAPESAHSLLADPSLRVLIVNLSLSEEHGREAPGVSFIRKVKQQRPDIGILSLKRRVDEHQLRAALDAGADACCLATTENARVRKAVKVVADGATWLDAEISHALFHHEPPHSNKEIYPRLSARETEILRLVVEGYTNEEIAEQLNRAYPTIRTHLVSIYRKLRVDDRVSAVVTALRYGLV